jgi:hypothetical protein
MSSVIIFVGRVLRTMKTVALVLLLAFAAGRVAADPTMREKITVSLAQPDQSPPPPRTAKQMVKHKDAEPEIDAEAAVKLPDYDVTAPRVHNKKKIELELAKNDVAMRQEVANLEVTELEKIIGGSAGRIYFVRQRMKLLDLQETILLTSLATADSEKDRKELMRLLAKDRYPTPR